MVPTVDFFGTKLSRMILGDNPFNGGSYIKEVRSGKEMKEFYTEDVILRALHEAEANGVNGYMALAEPFILRTLYHFRAQGGKMNIVFQSYPAIDLSINLRQMLECEPVGIYFQGTTFDNMYEKEQYGEIREKLKMIRDAGVAVGFGTHMPEAVLRAEHEGWEADFYSVCLYNARRYNRGRESGFITGKSNDLVFYPGDPEFMFAAIKEVKKPCIAFKIYAGGQIFVGKPPEEVPAIAENAIREAYANIKPTDVICLGIFQKYKDELRENIEIVNKVLRGECNCEK